MLLGEIAALACAMCWAISGVLFKSQSDELDSLSINALASSVAGIFFVGVSLSSWRAAQLFYLEGLTILYLAGSVFISIVVGDTLYLKSLSWAGVSRTLPLVAIYPLFTALLALLFLREGLTWKLVGGIILTMSGVYLVSASQEKGEPRSFSGDKRWLAPALALLAALCWAAGTTVLKCGLKEIDIFVANAVRMPLAAFLLLVAARRWGHLGRAKLKPVLIVLLASLVGSCVGGVLFLFALQNATTARATTLISTYPLAALPLAALFLKEKVLFRVVWGTLLAIGGIWLVMS